MASNIHEAIAEIYGNVGYVQKQRTQGLNYSYASESALIEALRPEMVKAGVYPAVLEYEVMHAETYTTSKGAVMNLVRVRATVAFTHAPSGTQLMVQAVGEGSDSGDKASNKAMTGAYKYALRQTFCIETGDDPDRTPSAEQERASNGNQHPAVNGKALQDTLKDMGIEAPRKFVAEAIGRDYRELNTPEIAAEAIARWAEKYDHDDPVEAIVALAQHKLEKNNPFHTEDSDWTRHEMEKDR